MDTAGLYLDWRYRDYGYSRTIPGLEVERLWIQKDQSSLNYSTQANRDHFPDTKKILLG